MTQIGGTGQTQKPTYVAADTAANGRPATGAPGDGAAALDPSRFAGSGLNLTGGRTSGIGMPPPGAQPTPPVAGYADQFGGQSYVQNGRDAGLLSLAGRAAAANPQLNAQIGAAIQAGNMSPQQVKALQTFLAGQGHSVGSKGVDGKYGPDTHAAMASFLNRQAAPAAQPAQQQPVQQQPMQQQPVQQQPMQQQPVQQPDQRPAQASLAGPTPTPTQQQAVPTTGQVPAAQPVGNPVTNPPGQGRVRVAAGTPVNNIANLRPVGAANTGQVAMQTVDALRRAGGESAVYTSAANGNREVAVWAPPGFDPSKPYNVLVYNHGVGGDNAKGLDRDHLAKTMTELNQNGGNTLLVMPKGPHPVHSWFSGKEDLGQVTNEAISRFSQQTGIPLGQPQQRILMGHSGGGKSIMHAMSKPDAPQFDRIMLADSTYGSWAGDTLAALRRSQPNAQIATVVTAHNLDNARNQLQRQGLAVHNMPGSGEYAGHYGAPAYMVKHFLGPRADLPFSPVRR